jgi:hypothetical protein
MTRLAIATLCGAFICAATAHAVGISGDISASALTGERLDTAGELVSTTPVYQTLRLKAGNLGDERLSFEGAYRVWFDAATDATDESDFRVYRAFLRWHDRDAHLDVKTGRQFVLQGVGRGYVDGVLAEKGIGSKQTVSLFGGQPLRGVGMETTPFANSEDLQWGARYRIRRLGAMNIGFSYAEMQLDGETGSRLVGLDAVYRISDRQTVNLRSDFDAVSNGIDRLSVAWSKSYEDGKATSLFAQYRQARLLATSRLKNITTDGFAVVRASMLYPVTDNTKLYAAIGGLNSGDTYGGTANIGLNWHTIRIGYQAASTASVIGNGVYVQGSYRVSRYLLVGGRTNWTYYERDRADAWSRTIGSAAYITVTPVRKLDITAEIREITNDTFEYQLEALLTLRYRFSHLQSPSN